MSNALPFPCLDVAVCLIRSPHHVLAAYNLQWETFTLPMTKRRRWQDPDVPIRFREEEWVDAAARAAAEWLGRTLRPSPLFLLDVAEYQQSDRAGLWQRYHFQVFSVTLEAEPAVVPGKIVEWLRPDDFLDDERRPISSTARDLSRLLRAEGKV